MIPKRKVPFTGTTLTWLMIDDIEHLVLAEWENEPPEPDVNFHGEFRIVAAWYEDEGDILEQASDEEAEDLRLRVLEYETARWAAMMEDAE